LNSLDTAQEVSLTARRDQDLLQISQYASAPIQGRIFLDEEDEFSDVEIQAPECTDGLAFLDWLSPHR
jgi:hypothetical protein